MSRCEAMIPVRINGRDRYQCCGREPADLHHKLTRARGGLILDQAGETHHHLYLCPEHHAGAHDRPAFDSGLLIMGYVTTHQDGNPLYVGPDPYLTEHYGPRSRD